MSRVQREHLNPLPILRIHGDARSHEVPGPQRVTRAQRRSKSAGAAPGPTHEVVHRAERAGAFVAHVALLRCAECGTEVPLEYVDARTLSVVRRMLRECRDHEGHIYCPNCGLVFGDTARPAEVHVAEFHPDAPDGHDERPLSGASPASVWWRTRDDEVNDRRARDRLATHGIHHRDLGDDGVSSFRSGERANWSRAQRFAFGARLRRDAQRFEDWVWFRKGCYDGARRAAAEVVSDPKTANPVRAVVVRAAKRAVSWGPLFATTSWLHAHPLCRLPPRESRTSGARAYAGFRAGKRELTRTWNAIREIEADLARLFAAEVLTLIGQDCLSAKACASVRVLRPSQVESARGLLRPIAVRALSRERRSLLHKARSSGKRSARLTKARTSLTAE